MNWFVFNKYNMASTNPVNSEGFYEVITSGQGVTQEDSVGEIVDNGFDARATEIQIFITPRGYWFVDNGEGVSDISKINRYCESGKKNDNETLGYYGLGLHSACATLGDTVYGVRSKNKETYCVKNKFLPYDEFKTWPEKLKNIVSEDLRNTYLGNDNDHTIVAISNENIENNSSIDEITDNITRFIEHTYCDKISQGNIIKINGVPINGKQYRYNKHMEDMYIEANIYDTNEDGVYIIKSSCNSFNHTIKIHNPLTDDIVKQGPFIKNTWKQKKHKSNNIELNEDNKIATISISIPKNTTNTVGGITLNLNGRNMKPRTPVVPTFVSNQYSSILTSQRLLIDGKNDYLNISVNKSRQYPDFDKCFKNKDMQALIYFIMHTMFNKKKLKVINENKNNDECKKECDSQENKDSVECKQAAGANENKLEEDTVTNQSTRMNYIKVKPHYRIRGDITVDQALEIIKKTYVLLKQNKTEDILENPTSAETFKKLDLWNHSIGLLKNKK